MSHHFSFYGNRGHHYVVFSQLRGGPVIAEICIRNSGAVVSRGICCAAHSLTGARLTHTSAHRAGGAVLGRGGSSPIGGWSVWTTGEKLQENGRSWRTV